MASSAQKTTEPRSSRVTFVAAGGAGSSLHETLPAPLVTPDCAYLLSVYCDWFLPPRGRDQGEVRPFDPASFWKDGCDWLLVRLLSVPDSPRSARVGLTRTRGSTVLCPSECGGSGSRKPISDSSPLARSQAPSSRPGLRLTEPASFPRWSFTSLPTYSCPQPVGCPSLVQSLFGMTLSVAVPGFAPASLSVGHPWPGYPSGARITGTTGLGGLKPRAASLPLPWVLGRS